MNTIGFEAKTPDFRLKGRKLALLYTMNTMKWIHMVAFLLLVVGGRNWGVTAGGWNVVNIAIGNWPMAEQAVYLLVGVSAVWLVIAHKKDCKMCAGGMGGGMSGMRPGGMM